MPAKSKSQQILFSMALAVRRGKLKRSEVSTSVLDIVDSDMSNKEIEDFTVLKENNIYGEIGVKFGGAAGGILEYSKENDLNLLKQQKNI